MIRKSRLRVLILGGVVICGAGCLTLPSSLVFASVADRLSGCLDKKGAGLHYWLA